MGTLEKNGFFKWILYLPALIYKFQLLQTIQCFCKNLKVKISFMITEILNPYWAT